VSATETDVLIVGGGVIGLATAYRMATNGASVRVIDASGTRGASWVAAGMLAPVSEAIFGEESLTRLNVAALPEFVAFAAELEAATGKPVGLRHEGTLSVAFNADDRAALARLSEFRTSLGLSSQQLTGSATRRLEPFLATEIRAGVLCADDLSVDNRQYLATVRLACENAGVLFTNATVQQITAHVVQTELGEAAGGTVVVCGGALSNRLIGLPVQPVKGQILRMQVPDRLTADGPLLSHTVRGIVRGSEIYLVPRQGGEVVIGATSEHQGMDTTVTAGGIYELLRSAYELMPISSEFSFVEALAGLRPGTPDNGPILGRLPTGVIVATGHYRNGILLSAGTARAVADLVAGKAVAEEWKAFSPERFRR
jgi:glycine oxidase